MRRITIIYEDAKPTVILDDSKVDIDQYSKELSGILKESNITILKTTSSTTILRPSKIVGIEIEELEEKVKTTPPKPPTPPKKRVLEEDIKLKKSSPKTKTTIKKNEDKITDVK